MAVRSWWSLALGADLCHPHEVHRVDRMRRGDGVQRQGRLGGPQRHRLHGRRLGHPRELLQIHRSRGFTPDHSPEGAKRWKDISECWPGRRADRMLSSPSLKSSKTSPARPMTPTAPWAHDRSGPRGLTQHRRRQRLGGKELGECAGELAGALPRRRVSRSSRSARSRRESAAARGSPMHRGDCSIAVCAPRDANRRESATRAA